MTTRTELLNFLIQRHKLTRYLEIGVQNKANNFDHILAPVKDCVDPDLMAEATYSMTSDQFFAPLEVTNKDSHAREFVGRGLVYDIIFIDGLHHADQARKDFFNADKILAPGGFIVLHDCNPPQEEYTHVPRDSKIWYGDVYKFAAQFSGNPNFYTVDLDCGCGVFSKTENHRVTGEEITWEYFDANRKRLLNLIPAEEFIRLHTKKTE